MTSRLLKFKNPAASDLLFFILLLLLSFVIFAPALHGEFIMDDFGFIVQNPQITASSPWHFWSSLDQPDLWPLSYSFYWLFYHLFGPEPAGYHAINIYVHAANAFLVFAIARQLGFKRAWLAALIFLVHPLHVQAVAWIVQFKTLLATNLGLSSFYAYLRFRSENRRGYFHASLILFGLSLLAKTSTACLPLMLLVYEISRDQRKITPRLKTLWGFFGLGIAAGLGTLWINSVNEADQILPLMKLSLLQRPLLVAQNFLFYLGNFFWPWPLASQYPSQVPHGPDLLPLFCVGTTLVLFGFALWFWKTRRNKVPAVFFALYVLALLPTLGFFNIPNFKLSLVMDHYAYFPDAFLIIALLSVWNALPLKKMTLNAGALVLLPLSFLSFTHARNFATEEIFWRQTEVVNPMSTSPFYNLGTVYERQLKFREAEAQYKLALDRDPKNAGAWLNLGWVNIQQGRMHDSIPFFENAIKLDPRNSKAYRNLIWVYESDHQRAKALEVLGEGLRALPNDPELLANQQKLAR